MYTRETKFNLLSHLTVFLEHHVGKFMAIFGQHSNSNDQVKHEATGFFFNIVENTMA